MSRLILLFRSLLICLLGHLAVLPRFLVRLIRYLDSLVVQNKTLLLLTFRTSPDSNGPGNSESEVEPPAWSQFRAAVFPIPLELHEPKLANSCLLNSRIYCSYIGEIQAAE
jgi:hypothetical protein